MKIEKNFGLFFLHWRESFLHSFPAKRLNFFFPRLLIVILITTTSNYYEAKESTSEKSGEREDDFSGGEGYER